MMENDDKLEMCPCGSGKSYMDCCEPFITKKKLPDTAEKLMRSRYTAYVKVQIDYILESTHPNHRKDINEKDTRRWAQKSVWDYLEIIKTENGTSEDTTGLVEFIAHYQLKGKIHVYHESATFEKLNDQWFFKEGKPVLPKQVIRNEPKIGRNDPCSCGSGKKYKKCCGK